MKASTLKLAALARAWRNQPAKVRRDVIRLLACIEQQDRDEVPHYAHNDMPDLAKSTLAEARALRMVRLLLLEAGRSGA